MVKFLHWKRFSRILKRFLDNTTIHACNFITMDNISIYEKIFWTLVNIITITLTIFWIRQLWFWYLNDSTVVNFDGTIPLHGIEYPGVAICNINKISKRRLYEFSMQLSPFLKEENISHIMQDVRLLGNLYDFNAYRQERFRYVQEILDKYDNLSDFSDPTSRLMDLVTPCKDILVQCKWNSQNYSCGELFLTRMTFDGFCCVFNYIRPSIRTYVYENHNIRKPPTVPETPHGSGIRFGLQVTLNNDLDDYIYTTMATTGYKVHFFLCRDFPDVLSGSLKEFLIGVNQRTIFNVEVDVIKSSPQVRSIPVHSRKCMFGSEGRTSFGAYTQSDCFVECKLRSMQALCNCIPFVMPIKPGSPKYRSVCTLIDVPCVSQYFRKWSKYFPRGVEIEDLELEQHDSLNCNCLPTCDGVNYRIYTNTVPLKIKRNLTKINIYFIKAYGNLYKIDTAFTWFELISAYGGLMSLVMGVSLISIVEVAVFLYKIFLYCVYEIYSTIM